MSKIKNILLFKNKNNKKQYYIKCKRRKGKFNKKCKTHSKQCQSTFKREYSIMKREIEAFFTKSTFVTNSGRAINLYGLVLFVWDNQSKIALLSSFTLS